MPDPKATLQYYDYVNSNLIVGLNEVDAHVNSKAKTRTLRISGNFKSVAQKLKFSKRCYVSVI